MSRVRASRCQLLNQLPSVSATQRQVRDDDVWVKIPRSTVSLLTIGSRDGLETQCDEALRRTVHACRRDHRRPVPKVARECSAGVVGPCA